MGVALRVGQDTSGAATAIDEYVPTDHAAQQRVAERPARLAADQ
jgi:hypothetical protein